MSKYENRCPTCGQPPGQQCVSLSRGKATDTHVARRQVDIMAAPRVELPQPPLAGITLPFARRRYSVYGNASALMDRGTAFVSFNLLEELLEADNSWGMGGAFLINDSDAQYALECAGLIHVEMRGGVWTDETQRARIHALLRREYL